MVIKVLLEYNTLRQGLYFPVSFAVRCGLRLGPSQWNGKEGVLPFLFPFPPGWNADAIAGAGAIILDHMMKAAH